MNEARAVVFALILSALVVTLAHPEADRQQLEEKNGFRDAIFGQPVEEFEGLALTDQDGHTSTYIPGNEEFTFRGVELKEMYYSFYRGKLGLIVLYAQGASTCEALEAALDAEYGVGSPPKVPPTWINKNMGIKFRAADPAKNEECSAWISSKPIYEQMARENP